MVVKFHSERPFNNGFDHSLRLRSESDSIGPVPLPFGKLRTGLARKGGIAFGGHPCLAQKVVHKRSIQFSVISTIPFIPFLFGKGRLNYSGGHPQLPRQEGSALLNHPQKGWKIRTI